MGVTQPDKERHPGHAGSWAGGGSPSVLSSEVRAGQPVRLRGSEGEFKAKELADGGLKIKSAVRGWCGLTSSHSRAGMTVLGAGVEKALS